MKRIVATLLSVVALSAYGQVSSPVYTVGGMAKLLQTNNALDELMVTGYVVGGVEAILINNRLCYNSKETPQMTPQEIKDATDVLAASVLEGLRLNPGNGMSTPLMAYMTATFRSTLRCK